MGPELDLSRKDWAKVRDYRLRSRVCAFPNCDQPAIASHVVAKQHLKSVSEGGHVVSPQYIERVGFSEFGIGPIGISKFPRMTLYCAKHDNGLFAEFEKHAKLTPDSARAILHRARHYELIKKRSFEILGTTTATRAMMRGTLTAPLAEHYRKAWTAGIAIAEKNAHAADEILLSGSELEILQLRVKLPSVVCAAGAIGPLFDLKGNMLQTGLEWFPFYKTLGLYIYSDPEGATLTLIGEKGDDLTLLFLNSFREYPKGKLRPHFLTIIFWMTEDVFVRPDFFNQLPLFYIEELHRYVSTSLCPFQGSQLHSMKVRRPRIKS
jgi:hypothetical protein